MFPFAGWSIASSARRFRGAGNSGNAPLLAAIAGHRVPGCHVEQACATGLKAVVQAVMEVQSGSFDVVGVLTFDRASDSSVGIFPERRGPARTLRSTMFGTTSVLIRPREHRCSWRPATRPSTR